MAFFYQIPLEIKTLRAESLLPSVRPEAEEVLTASGAAVLLLRQSSPGWWLCILSLLPSRSPADSPVAELCCGGEDTLA